MSDSAEVKLGADTSGATSGMTEAQAAITSSLKNISSSLQNFGAQNKAVAAESVAANQKIVHSFLGLHETIIGKLGSVNSAFIRFRDTLGSLAAVLAGGMIFKAAISGMLTLENEVRTLEMSMGMSSEKATTFAIALKLAGSSAEAFAAMAQRVGQQLRVPNSELDRLKVVTRDATGNFLPMEEILQNVYKRMQDFRTGTDQAEFALATVGRSAKDFSNDMQRLSAATDRATQMQHELGIEMGPTHQADIEAYRMKINAFTVTLEAIGDKIGEAVMPSLERLAQWMNGIGPKAVEYIVDAIKAFVTVLQFMGSAISVGAIKIASFFQDMQTRAREGGAVAVAVVTNDWTQIPAIIHRANMVVEANAKETNDSIVAIWADGAAKIKALWSDVAGNNRFGMNDRSGVTPGKGTERFTRRPTAGAGANDELQKWKDELELIKMAEGSFHELSLRNEEAFWQQKLALVSGNGKAEVKLREELHRLIFAAKKAADNAEVQSELAKYQRMIDAAKSNEAKQLGLARLRTDLVKSLYGEESKEYERALTLELKLRQQWAQKDAAIVKDAAKHNEQMAPLEVASEIQGLNQQVALRQVSAQQKFAIEQELENKLYALKHQEMEDELATLQVGTIASQQQAEAIEVLEVQHQQRLTQIANAAELDRKQVALTAARDIQTAFGTLLDDLMNGTKSFKQAFGDMIKTITADLNKLASEQIAKQLFGAGTQGGGFLNKLMGGIFGGGGAAAGGAGAAVDTAHTAAVTADTAATTAQTAVTTTLSASFTIFETGLAALTAAAQSAAAAMMSIGASGGAAGLGSLFSSVPIFETGTPYVPQDTLAYVHKGEAIVPAGMNHGGRTSTGASLSMHNTFVLQGAIDTRTQDQIAAVTYLAAQRGAARIL